MTIQSTDRGTANKELVQEFIQDLFTRGDLGAVDRPLPGPGLREPRPALPAGPEGMRQAADAFRRACPDWHSDVALLVAEGDMVVERSAAPR